MAPASPAEKVGWSSVALRRRKARFIRRWSGGRAEAQHVLLGAVLACERDAGAPEIVDPAATQAQGAAVDAQALVRVVVGAHAAELDAPPTVLRLRVRHDQVLGAGRAAEL